MSYLLDTVVISESMQKVPDRSVEDWLLLTDEDLQFISVVSLGEIQKGISKLAPSDRKIRLENWVSELEAKFSNRLLTFDLSTARLWGKLQARLETHGRPLPVMDSMIAATALQHGLTVVTRNAKDFEAANVDVLNLWESN